MKKLLCACFVLAFALGCASVVWGQSQITAGTVQGDVLDEKGGSIAGASIEAKNLDTNFTQSGTTNTDGHFAFLSLAPGRYTLTISKQGFATVIQQNVNLTVGQTINIPITLKVSSVAEAVTVTDVPILETTETESTSTINELAVSSTPVLGRKFEDLLTLTPGVAITQGPDGDEINFSGQRGVFNNISLDGGDYNNGFFGEQLGGQRAAIDITLDAVKEFQVVASGASAEFGRTAGGVVNVITKSGTNELHGSLFEYFRTEGLTANTSDGKPLKDFRRNQFGGTVGGPIVRDKMFIFGAFEQIIADLTRLNLSAPFGTPCAISNPVFNTNITDAQISASADCQRLVLLNFLKSSPLNQNDGLPVKHPIRNSAALGRFDWNLSAKNQLAVSYNFDYSKNTDQTFDVATYGNSANGIEGPSKINVINANYFTTVSTSKLNEGHFSFQREDRPRAAVSSNIPADTAMGFVTSFRFGAPFFLEPKIDETIWRTQLRDNFTVIHGKHNFKFGGDWLHTNNSQVFRGFFTGRYIFDSPVGFLHYASSSCTGTACGPRATECSNGSFVDASASCPGTATKTGGPLIFYLQDGIPTGAVSIKPGASNINNEDVALFAQDKWQIFPTFSLSYGLRWEAQIFPSPTVPPSQTAYGSYLSNPRFPSDGTLHSAKKEFQPRVGFAWDARNNHKSVLRASYGIYYARQNMLSQVGSITTNGAQQFTAFCNSSFAFTCFGLAPNPPGWPGKLTVPTPGTIPPGAGVRVFSKHYENPRIYTTNVAYEQEILPNLSAYADFTMSKGVHLTTFLDATKGYFADDGTFVNLSATPSPFPNLGGMMITASTAKSLYRGLTLGMRKRFSQRFQLEWNYVVSEDLDTDSNERDPFTDRRLNPLFPAMNYGFSDRDERHKFNLFGYYELPGGFNVDTRLQAHTPQPITSPQCDAILTGNNAPLGCKRNTLWKSNEYISFDWRAMRPFNVGEHYKLIPAVEMFNTFNNRNNINPLVTPALFNFDGFLRVGVGDPRQAQLSVRFEF